MSEQEIAERVGSLFAEATTLLNTIYPRLLEVMTEVTNLIEETEIIDKLEDDHPTIKELERTDEISRKMAYILTYGPENVDSVA